MREKHYQPPGRHRGHLSRRQLLTSAAACLVAGSAAACARAPRVVAAGERVVSLSPSTTEMMFTIGAGDLLVGRTSACNRPAAALKLPVVGGFGTVNFEVLLSLRPTVVVGSRGPAGPLLPQRLAKHGVEVLLPATNSMAEVQQAVKSFGERFARQPTADRVVAAMQQRITQVQRWAAARPPVRALMVFDANPTYVAGPGGFPDGLLRLAGAHNVITRGGPYPIVDIEQLLRLNPYVLVDAIALGQTGPSRLPDTPGWTLLPAVQKGRVRRLTSDAALRPGPRLAEGLVELAAAVHGVTPS